MRKLSSFELRKKAEEIRKDVLQTAVKHNLGHIASSLSCLELLVAIYYEVKDPNDVVILSKGHGCYALYSILADLGILPDSNWHQWTGISGCVEHNPEVGLFGSTGSLGHGVGTAVGLALANQQLQNGRIVYCIAGDAELQEGSCLEAIDFAENVGRLPLKLIIDCNQYGALQEDIEPHLFSNQFFFDGHDFDQILYALTESRQGIVFAKTVKGKGVPFMEGDSKWHYRVPSTPEELSWINSYVSSKETEDESY